jgi:acetyl esterase/lipase
VAIWTSHGIGRAAPDEADVVMLPATYRLDGSRPGIVYCHPADGSALNGSDPLQKPGEWRLLRGLAEYVPVAVTDLGGPVTYGNDDAVARIDGARDLLARFGAASGPVALVATSMGAVAALRYAAAHRDQVWAVVAVLPLVDLVGAYQDDIGDQADEIARAWGLVRLLGQKLPAGVSPLELVDQLRGLPLQCWTASNDPVLPSAVTAGFVAQLGPPAETHDLGPLGHTEEAIAAVPFAAVLSYLVGAAATGARAVA